MSVRRVPFLPVAIVAAAIALSVRAAPAGCDSCGCGPGSAVCGGVLVEVEPVAMPVYPLQPTYHVEQGPTYHAVIVADDLVERRLTFAHPHYFPYMLSWFGDRRWRARPDR